MPEKKPTSGSKSWPVIHFHHLDWPNLLGPKWEIQHEIPLSFRTHLIGSSLIIGASGIDQRIKLDWMTARTAGEADRMLENWKGHSNSPHLYFETEPPHLIGHRTFHHSEKIHEKKYPSHALTRFGNLVIRISDVSESAQHLDSFYHHLKEILHSPFHIQPAEWKKAELRAFPFDETGQAHILIHSRKRKGISRVFLSRDQEACFKGLSRSLVWVPGQENEEGFYEIEKEGKLLKVTHFMQDE